MKIILYSSVFLPSLGGMEITADTLANNIVNLGHDCILITETHSFPDKEEPRSYQVIRQPTIKERLNLVRQCAIVHSIGASIAMFPYAKLCGKPFIWTHTGYQVSCVDGLGWLDGEPAPMTPIASLVYHLKKKGWIHFLKESCKLAVKRYVTTQVDLNIAQTQWVASRQPLKNQIVACTPYPIKLFANARRLLLPKKYDFIYVGRLVSEKGVGDLILAFHLLVYTSGYQDKILAIVGDGPLKAHLQDMVIQLNLCKNVLFLGSKAGTELIEAISYAKVGVVPSIWEEPLGGVALELLASGRNIIVSEYGGHAECVGNAGLKFKNGDFQSLHQKMVEIIENEYIAEKQLQEATLQLDLFDEFVLTKRYIRIYEKVIFKSKTVI